MINNKLRIGNFTSSNIYKLVGAPKPIQTYIDQKNLERRLNKSIETDAYSQAMAWGIFLEQRVFELLGMEYELCSDQTDLHPEISFWAGSKDLKVEKVKIGEIKCFQLENFAYYTDAILKKDTEYLKKEFPKEYWQAVSNSIINQVPNAEIISYCPYYSELDEIKQMALDYGGDDTWKYRFIYEKPHIELPHLDEGGFYKNLNRFEFEVPKSDRDLLTEKVKEAGKKLVKFHING